MSFPINHKTIFVLDQGQSFKLPCAQVDFDFHKSRIAVGTYIPPAPVVKTMWTSATEAVLEYCRIVWDLWSPEDKLVRFVVAGGDATHVVNDWSAEQQTTAFVSAGLARCRWPPEGGSKKSSSLTDGLAAAVKILTEVTPTQQKMTCQSEENGNGASSRLQLINRGRIICLTHAQDDRHVDQLVREVQRQLEEANQEALSRDNSSVLNKVSLEVVHCYPGSGAGASPIVSPTDAPLDASPQLSYRVISVDAGTGLARKLLYMALYHFQLASTTVTGIPMKEEQNAASSANYDVELFHAASAHTRLLDGSSGFDTGSGGLAQTVKEGCEYKTITLKWCTPRGSVADMHFVTGVARITPTDVNSRPSSCLTNFLLAGRSVMLELPRRSGTKVLSHMLTSHGGEIFIHTLNTSRSSLEDPPSISEGPGGRVTDYRITDLAQLMRDNRLAPWFSDRGPTAAGDRLRRHTLLCPLTIGSTTIFNMASLEGLQRIMVQDELSEEDLGECRKAIYALLAMESKGDVLPGPVQTTAGGKTKSTKKDEQYRIMFQELERFLASHARTERHAKVLDCLLEVRNKPLTERPLTVVRQQPHTGSSNASGGNKIDVEVALREMDRYNAMTERERSDFDLSVDGVLRSTTESPMSPTAVCTSAPTLQPRAASKKNSSRQSLLDIWTGKVEKEHSKKHVPFHGLRNLGEKAKLYLSLEKLKEAEKVD